MFLDIKIPAPYEPDSGLQMYNTGGPSHFFFYFFVSYSTISLKSAGYIQVLGKKSNSLGNSF